MKQKITLRPLIKDDAEEYVKLHNIVWENAYQHIFPNEVFKERSHRTQSRIDNFASWIDNNYQQINYAAEIDGKIVACMSGTISSNYQYFKDLGYAELMGLYILPEYQGLGIGTKLKNLFLDWAKMQGANKFVIGVLKDNHKARTIYEKWGGKLSNYTQPFIKLGKSYEEVFYTYNL